MRVDRPGLCVRPSPEGSGVAYTGMNLGGEGYVVKWETEGWTVKSKSKVTRDPISAMALAPDGSTLAVGNSEGHVCVVDGGSLAVRSVEKGAHMIFVTTMAYNTDGSVVLSGSAVSRRGSRRGRGRAEGGPGKMNHESAPDCSCYPGKSNRLFQKVKIVSLPLILPPPLYGTGYSSRERENETHDDE